MIIDIYMTECKYCNKEFIPVPCMEDKQITCGSKECKKAQQKEWRYEYHRRPERMKYRNKYIKEYRKRDKYKDWFNKYYADGKHEICRKKYKSSESYKKWKEDYKKSKAYELKLKKISAYFKTPKGRKLRNEHSLLRHERKNHCIHKWTMNDFMKKVIATKGVCPCCNNLFDDYKHKLNVDHIYPISKASEDFIKTGVKRIYTIDDIQPLCATCNREKSNKILSDTTT